MRPEDEIIQQNDLKELLEETTVTATVFILHRSTTSTPIGSVTHSWATGTSVQCAVQHIPAFRRIQEGLLVAAGSENVVTTHRGFLKRAETIKNTDRIETSSGAAYDIKNVRTMDSHIELDMIRTQND